MPGSVVRKLLEPLACVAPLFRGSFWAATGFVPAVLLFFFLWPISALLASFVVLLFLSSGPCYGRFAASVPFRCALVQAAFARKPGFVVRLLLSNQRLVGFFCRLALFLCQVTGFLAFLFLLSVLFAPLISG